MRSTVIKNNNDNIAGRSRCFVIKWLNYDLNIMRKMKHLYKYTRGLKEKEYILNYVCFSIETDCGTDYVIGNLQFTTKITKSIVSKLYDGCFIINNSIFVKKDCTFEEFGIQIKRNDLISKKVSEDKQKTEQIVIEKKEKDKDIVSNEECNIIKPKEDLIEKSRMKQVHERADHELHEEERERELIRREIRRELDNGEIIIHEPKLKEELDENEKARMKQVHKRVDRELFEDGRERELIRQEIRREFDEESLDFDEEIQTVFDEYEFDIPFRDEIPIVPRTESVKFRINIDHLFDDSDFSYSCDSDESEDDL
jgi:hypothetical protein